MGKIFEDSNRLFFNIKRPLLNCVKDRQTKRNVYTKSEQIAYGKNGKHS